MNRKQIEKYLEEALKEITQTEKIEGIVVSECNDYDEDELEALIAAFMQMELNSNDNAINYFSTVSDIDDYHNYYIECKEKKDKVGMKKWFKAIEDKIESYCFNREGA